MSDDLYTKSIKVLKKLKTDVIKTRKKTGIYGQQQYFYDKFKKIEKEIDNMIKGME